MTKDKEREQEQEQGRRAYTTLDAYQSGFLTLREHTPELIEQGVKTVFSFPMSDRLLKDLQDYTNGAIVEAYKFAFAIKSLKSQIHSMRRDKDYGKKAWR